MEIWPNFFIVGAHKAGTTLLYSYLQKIPEIYMSPMKEPRFFNSTKYKEKLPYSITKESEYLKLFRGVKQEKAIGESSPFYLFDPDSANLIHDSIPEAKAIIILRDPIERLFSAYLMHKSKGRLDQPFHELVVKNIQNPDSIILDNFSLKNSLYSPSVSRFIKIFGENKVKVLIFEEFTEDPETTVNEVLEFLGVKARAPKTEEKKINPYGVPRGKLARLILGSKTLTRIGVKIIPQSLQWKVKDNLLYKQEEKPEISKPDRVSLEEFYRSDVKELGIILKRKFPWLWVND